MNSVPKPLKQDRKKKKKKSKLQVKKDNFLSGYWLKKADTEFSYIYHTFYSTKICGVAKNIIKINELDQCEGKIEMAHLIPRENYLWRWSLDNMIDICSKHHRFSRVISSHYAPIQFSIFLKEFYPVKYKFVENHRWEAITRKIELPFTFKEKYEELIEMRKELESNQNTI